MNELENEIIEDLKEMSCALDGWNHLELLINEAKNQELQEVSNMKKYRFFYHYYKQYNEMSVHFRDNCYRTKNVICNVPSETKWNKTQPYLVMQGFASSIEEIEGSIIIN